MVEKIKQNFRYRGALAAPLLGCLLLFGIVLEKVSVRLPVADARPYHKHVREVAQKLPTLMGDWVGMDVAVSTAVVSVLKPNVMISRHFVNVRTGHEATVLLAQFSDRRDLLGHYPPVCYPSQGWRIVSDKYWNVMVDEVLIPAREYKLVKSGPNNADQMIVGNFLIVPDGRLVRDMTGLGGLSVNKYHNQFGAAQMQVVIHGYLAANVREQIFRELVIGHYPLIQAIQSGKH
ncbi:exosortase-associated EpsI family protein [bacterium AH-315-I18]|nr:exosortase-associated EpsI family protein [Phycisphaeraceae bacterium]MBN4061119.1 exosortase-associated EpsI family protein [bacterium AH-315-I18]